MSLAAGCLAGALAVAHPVTSALAVLAAAAVPIVLGRPDLLILSVLPLSVAHLASVADDLRGVLLVSLAVGLLLVPTLRSQVRRARPLRPGWPAFCAAALTGLLLLSTMTRDNAWAPDLPGRFSGLSHLIVIVGGLFLLAAVTVWPPNPADVARLVALTGGIVGAYALLRGHYNGGRLEALGINSNYLAAVAAPSVGASVALARQPRRLAYLAPAVVALVAVQQTQSRAGILAAAAGVLVALISNRPVRQQMIGIALSGLLAAVVYVFRKPIWTVVFDERPMSQLTDDSGRAGVLSATINAIAEHPFNGIGYRMFPYYALNYPEVGRFLKTHNDYLGLAAEAGIPAALLLVTLVIAGLVVRGNALLTPLRAAVAAGAVTLAFANVLVCPVAIVGFWICLGCLLADRRHTAADGPAPRPHPNREENHAR
ncbi:O-antigen ligase family protein [Micromonospora sp. WMMD1102]|uniref:O-antigen ligase family protein n=1 Tax=Micromonospora sp. WMMD1102 TaxID=3016105 RepID=UPI002414D56A|nr:O-antigen ligase family protein [Micromonospora sp. WMMD1102]MDG4786393.1 O-antigen ligase family protein [Micromonospora sp. WMMD1102]